MTFFIFLLACAAAASTGMFFKPGAWYESLVKPSFTPPNWLFPVAWTLIYLLLAWAGYRLSLMPGSQTVLALWAAQIALNTLWTPVFFGAHRLLAGMVILAVLWLTVAAVMVSIVGSIGFVGLVIPHAVRLLLGTGHSRLLPASALGGALFLIAADVLSRTLIKGQVIPVGVVTALVGAPVFALILIGRRNAR
jgi:tryptophan-rich sensory protein